MFHIRARKLLDHTAETLKKMLCGDYEVEFDDTTVVTSGKDLILSRYAWDIHNHFPETPLNAAMRLGAINPKGYFSLGDFIELANRCFWPAYDAYKDRYDNRDELCRLTYEASDNLYNGMVNHTLPWMSSLDITDFIAITNHPKIREAVAKADGSNESIAHCYKVATDLILYSPEFDDNRQAIAIRSGLVNVTQALQNTVLRGFMRDINTRVFPKAIMRPYVAGIRDIYSAGIESRAAAESLTNQHSPLQQSEYASRSLQLDGVVLRHLHKGDCGSTKTMSYLIHSGIRDASGEILEKETFSRVVGMNYIDGDGSVKRILPEDKKALEGRYLRLRNPVSGCAHPDPYGICETCYGGLADTVPVGSNLGHLVIALLFQLFGQGLLSLKHKIGSAVVDGIVFDDFSKKHLVQEAGTMDIRLTGFNKNDAYKIHISTDALPGLVELKDFEDYERIGVSRISKINAVTLIREYKEGDVDYCERSVLTIGDGKKLAALSYQALRFIKENDITPNKDNFIEIDLDEWPMEQPFFTLPAMQYSINEHRRDVTKLLKSEVGNIVRRENIDTPEKILMELDALVSMKMNVPLSILATILYSGMVVSMTNRDYALPKAYTTSTTGVLSVTVVGRGMSGTLSLEDHKRQLSSISNFIEQNRIDHPMDIFFAPEALEHEIEIEEEASRTA